jgi:hypothetical protein
VEPRLGKCDELKATYARHSLAPRAGSIFGANLVSTLLDWGALSCNHLLVT